MMTFLAVSVILTQLGHAPNLILNGSVDLPQPSELVSVSCPERASTDEEFPAECFSVALPHFEAAYGAVEKGLASLGWSKVDTLHNMIMYERTTNEGACRRLVSMVVWEGEDDGPVTLWFVSPRNPTSCFEGNTP